LKDVSEMTMGELAESLQDAQEALQIAKDNFEFEEQQTQKEKIKEIQNAMTARMLPGAAAAI
jgi:hypothetical protein